MKVLDMGLVNERRLANDIHAQTFWMDWAVIWDKMPIAWFMTQDQVMRDWGHLWSEYYYSEGEIGEKPPKEVQQFIDAMDTALATNDDATRQKAMDDVYQLLYDNIFFFPIAESGYPMIYNKDMGNMPVDTEFGIVAAYSAEQFYYKR